MVDLLDVNSWALDNSTCGIISRLQEEEVCS